MGTETELKFEVAPQDLWKPHLARRLTGERMAPVKRIVNLTTVLAHSSGEWIETILGAQIRAARALLRWAAVDLVREFGVSLATIQRAEAVDGKTALTLANAFAVRRVFEAAGIEFVEENGGGPGARLKKPTKT